MSLKLTILGCHSATPRTFAHPTSQFLEINNRAFLIDCGEGTQVQLRKYKIKFSRIDNIFISHLHGDHFFGLIGLISTFGLLKRTNDLHIYGPKGIGALFIKQGIKLDPLFYGGSHEKKRRPGTENIAGIVGLAKTLEIAQKRMEDDNKR